MQKIIPALLSVLLLVSHAHAELYKWIDSAGRENFVDDPAKVPEQYREEATKLTPSGEQLNVESRPADNSFNSVNTQLYTDDHGRGEAWWRNQADGIRRNIRLKQEDLDYYYGIRKECAEAQKNIISPRNRDCESLYADTILRGEQEIARLRNRLETDLPEEARRAGASPGWIRESGHTPARASVHSGRDEASWRSRAATLREQLREAEDSLNSANEQERQCEEDQKYNTGCRKKNCKVMYESRKKYAERRVRSLKQSLEVDLPEEARRAGVYPGWLRE